jgi:hypothetical protein
VQWDFICGDWMIGGPEDAYDFSEDIETIFFEGFITYCVAWYHKPSKTLIQSDLMMNLPCTEVCSMPSEFHAGAYLRKTNEPKQYSPPSSEQGPLSREFAKRAHSRSVWAKRLIYYIASVNYTLMRRDAKRVAEWDIERIIPCHGDVLHRGGNEAWASTYEWYLKGKSEPGVLLRIRKPFMNLMRWLFLM